MSLEIATFEDLLNIVNTHPEWRRKLIKALFPEIDLPKAIQELAESNRLMREELRARTESLTTIADRMGGMEFRLDRLNTAQETTQTELGEVKTRLGGVETELGEVKTRLDGVKTRLDGVETRLDGVETELSEVKTRLDGVETRLDGVEKEVRYLRRDVGELKGDSYEREIRDKASAVFGYVVRRGRDIHRYLNERLHQAVDEGRLTVAEHRQIMASDLIWEGRPRGSEGTVILVVEASWLAEKNDVERALLRAELLRRLGFQALPVVGGKVWDKQAEALAKEQGVVRVHDLNLDDESWNKAMNRLKKDLASS